MCKKLLLLILVICMLASVGCKGKKSQPAITFSESGVLTVEVLTTTDGGTVTLPQPAGTHGAYCVGWMAKTEGKTIFLPVGAQFAYAQGDNISFTPVYLHLTTTNHVALDLAIADGGIRYTSMIKEGEWNLLTSIGAAPRAGTLIVPQSGYEAMLDFTHEAVVSLPEAMKRWDCPAEMAENLTSFDALLKDIPIGNRLTPFTAIGYVQLTYTDGSTAYVYAKAEEAGLPSASLLGLSKAAAEDLSARPTDVYVTQVGDKYSPYTPAEYALLKEFSKITLSLIVNHDVRGNRGLASNLLDAFEQRTIQQGDASCTEEWRILRGLITDIKQNGALVISAKDGTPIERDNITEITFQTNSADVVLKIENAVYYNGSIYVPYTTYSSNY